MSNSSLIYESKNQLFTTIPRQLAHAMNFFNKCRVGWFFENGDLVIRLSNHQKGRKKSNETIIQVFKGQFKTTVLRQLAFAKGFGDGGRIVWLQNADTLILRKEVN